MQAVDHPVAGRRLDGEPAAPPPPGARPDQRRRVLDGLIGAGIAVLVLAAVVALFLWSISDAPGTGEQPGPAAPRRCAARR